MKFKLNFGVKVDGQFVINSEIVELENLDIAGREARDYAEDLYMQNPKRDINEIEKMDGVDEDTAGIIFKLEMFRNTIYFAEVAE